MLRLKTKQEKTIPSGRGTATAIVHLIIDELHINGESYGIVPDDLEEDE